MNQEQPRSNVVRYWWSKAEESLASAQREVEAGSLAFAMNRVYYAAFHREFIKKGVLDSNWGKFYDQLFEDRHEGDYVALIDFERDYVLNQLARCRDFLIHLRPLVASLK